MTFLIVRKCKTQQVNYNEKTELKVLQEGCFLLNFYIFSNKMQHYVSHFLKVFDLEIDASAKSWGKIVVTKI